MIVISKYILYFVIYSFLGWLMEVILFMVEDHKFVNRGFLIGPICPIYGWGVLLIVFLIDGNKGDLLAVFLKSIFICSVLEYFTSFVMEKLFQARWWDYSNNRFNINGRICLETMIPFGLLGTTVVLYVHPFITTMVNKLPTIMILVFGLIFGLLVLIDHFISLNVMSKIKHEIKRHDIDSTEDIRKKVMKWLSSNTLLFRRITRAFPGFKIIRRVKEKIIK